GWVLPPDEDSLPAGPALPSSVKVVLDGCTGTVFLPGGACDLIVRFTPAIDDSNPLGGSLRIVWDPAIAAFADPNSTLTDASGLYQDVYVVASVAPPPVRLSPTLLDFGDVPVGT